MPKYTVIQSYTAQDIWKNVEAKDKQEAIDICMGGRDVDENNHEDTFTDVKFDIFEDIEGLVRVNFVVDIEEDQDE